MRYPESYSLQESSLVSFEKFLMIFLAYPSDDALAVSKTTYSSYANLVAMVDERSDGRRIALYQIDFDPGWGNVHWNAAIKIDYLVSCMHSIDSSNLVMVGRKVNDLAFFRVRVRFSLNLTFRFL